MEKIGDRIAAARKSKGWTQGQLGDKVNLSATGISSIENGKSESPESINAILACFKEWRQWVETGEGSPPKGLIVPIRKELAENPWKDFAIQKMQDEIDFLRGVIKQLSAGKAKENFLKAPIKAGAGKVISMFANNTSARVGVQA